MTQETMITIPQSEFEFLLFCKQRLINLHDAKIQKCYEEMQQRHVETIVNSYDNTIETMEQVFKSLTPEEIEKLREEANKGNPNIAWPLLISLFGGVENLPLEHILKSIPQGYLDTLINSVKNNTLVDDKTREELIKKLTEIKNKVEK